MRKQLLLWGFAFLTFCAAAQTTNLPQIRVKGNNFVGPDDKPMIFRGLNASDPERLANMGRWDSTYFREMKNWGANIARFPVHPTAWRRQGKERYLKLLDDGVRWASEQGIYVIIDWHSIGNLRTGMYQDEMYETTQKETFEFWRTMAKHFKGSTTVAFFELFNEPTTFNGQLGTCTWADWKALNEEIIGIIRAHGNEASIRVIRVPVEPRRAL